MPVTILRTLILGALFFCQFSHAEVLVMKNGDQITGKVTLIWDNEVTIEPVYADKFTVKMVAIDRIESERAFKMELLDGTEIVGTPVGSDAAGNQLIEVDGETIAVPLMELSELEEVQKDFELDSHIDMTAALNKGNTDSSNSQLKADSTVRMGDHRHIATLTFMREEVSGVQSQEQDLFEYDYNWLFNDPWFMSTRLSYESNPVIGLDERIIGSVGIGRDIWNTPKRLLSMQLGAGVQSEDTDLESTTNEVVTWTLRYEQKFLNDDLDAFHNHTITTNVSGRDNTTFRTSTGFRYEIKDLLYGTISLDYDYVTDPIDDATNEDLALRVGFGLEFDVKK